ncbi:hypothetical protein GCM10022226_70720 [Sphaerisporangium flaviroseum]|uniref:AAA domain-containing protein n=1 Tax=Sphaerisporangium flaviroseum TaxID=509199 RepID=A0ABP7J9H1_9ACTN
MDLPTYTNIWRIEKRLYKLYDLRLPMPLPIVWIGVFVGVLVPWSILLALVNIPFDAPWHVLYLVPPGIVTWLSTRPVIESKRLNELLQSQVRYLGEPKTWCRLAPVDEPDEITFSARVWRSAPDAARLVSADSVKSAAKARRGTRARPKHTAPRRRPLEAWSPSRQLPSVKQGSRRGVPAPGEVRPAVAAAAAAAAALPAAETPLRVTESPVRVSERPVRVSERPRVTWGSVVNQPAAALPPGSATARSTGASGPSPDRITEIPRLTSDRAAESLASRPDRVPESPAYQPDRAAEYPVARPDRVPESRAPEPERVVDPRSQKPGGITGLPRPNPQPPAEPVVYRLPPAASKVLLPPTVPGVSAKPPAGSPEVLGTTPAGPQAERPAVAETAVSGLSAVRPQAPPPVHEPETVSSTPAAREPEAGPSAPAPIGTEALRRLRRLAASAESRGASASGPRPASSPQSASGPQIAYPGRQTAGPEHQAAAAPQVPSTGLQSTPAGAEGTASAEKNPAAMAEGSMTGVQAHAPAGAAPDAEPDVREKHRKGQPPRPAAHSRLPEARTVWPASRSRTPETPLATGSGQVGPEQAVPSKPAAPSKQAPPRIPVRSTAREQAPPPLSIRTVPAASGRTADPAAPSVPVPVPRTGDEPRVRRVESVVGRDQSGGWRRLAQVVVGGGAPSRNDGIETDEARARTVLTGSRRVVVLGCTGGAGQTTTALMLGHTLARYREDRVVAVDANTGDHTMTGRIPADSPETLTSLLAGLDGVSGYLSMRTYTTRCESGLEVIGSDSDAAAARRLADQGLFSDERLAQAMRVLDRHYRLILVDPAASVAARMLPHADQLILVAPASEDAPEAVAMTFDWLDGHGSTELRRRAIMVINGVSRRSMGGVEQAEAVARGRCRAIVRVPWEDELAPGHAGPAQLTHLRSGGRRAYIALAGVVASGLAAAGRPSEEEVAQ